jgi:hypothetical protein
MPNKSYPIYGISFALFVFCIFLSTMESTVENSVLQIALDNAIHINYTSATYRQAE